LQSNKLTVLRKSAKWEATNMVGWYRLLSLSRD